MRETTEFSARRAEFDALDAKLVGISVDPIDEQKTHAATCNVTFPILSDGDKSLVTRLGILNERGRARRTTYVLDPAGNVRQVFNDVQIDGHVDQVLDAVKAL